MVRVWETSGGHHIMRRASDGRVVLDTSTPMPIIPDAATYQGSWTGAEVQCQPGSWSLNPSNGVATWTTRNSIETVTLGALPSGQPTPDFWFGKMRARRTTGPSITSADRFNFYMVTPVINTWSAWMPFSGSVLLEYFFNDNDPPMGFRHMNVALVGGNWIIEVRTSTGSPTISATLSTFDLRIWYEFDIDLMWGVFK